MNRTGTAFLLSFLVWLLPVVHAHGGTLFGLALWAELLGGYADREALWMAMDAGLAVLLQAGAFGLFLWIFSGSRMRWLTLVPAIPAAVWLLNIAYMWAIPTLFLVESDDRPEVGNWPVICEIPDASTIGLTTGVTLALERAGEIWLRLEKGNAYGLLSARACSAASRELFFPGARGGIGYVTAGGSMYYRIDPEGDGVFDHWYFGAGAPGATKLAVPATVDYWLPTVASEGGALAWLETERDDNGRITTHILALQRVAEGTTRRIALALEPYSSPRLLDFSLDRGEFLVLRNYRQVLRIGMDGTGRGKPLHPEGFESFGDNIRVLDGGWVVWDGYRDAGRYRVAWSLPGGQGLYEIPKGRGITSLSVTPDGRYIAVSTTRNLSIGNVPDTVFVFRTSDGTEVYRRYLPPYSRSHVGFLGPDRLAITTVEDGRPRVLVFAVPSD